MTNKELAEVFDEFKAQGHSEEDILAMLYMMFQDDKIDVEELGEMVDVLGYELTPEFLQMSPEDQKTKGYEEEEETDATEEEIEDAKEIDEDESKDEKSEEPKKSEESEESEKPDFDKKDEDDDEKKAMNLFGLNNKK